MTDPGSIRNLEALQEDDDERRGLQRESCRSGSWTNPFLIRVVALYQMREQKTPAANGRGFGPAMLAELPLCEQIADFSVVVDDEDMRERFHEL